MIVPRSNCEGNVFISGAAGEHFPCGSAKIGQRGLFAVFIHDFDAMVRPKTATPHGDGIRAVVFDFQVELDRVFVGEFGFVQTHIEGDAFRGDRLVLNAAYLLHADQ